MWLGRDPAIIRDPACIAYLIYTAPASKQDPALIWTRLINGHIRYIYKYNYDVIFSLFVCICLLCFICNFYTYAAEAGASGLKSH